MNLKRQLLLVSVLTLMLPWAGCEFIRETESALRSTQQQMLAGTARAMANDIAQYGEKFPGISVDWSSNDQLYLHPLERRPEIDGYFDDWLLTNASLRYLRGPDGPIRLAVARFHEDVFLYVEVSDHNVVYATAQAMILDDGPLVA